MAPDELGCEQGFLAGFELQEVCFALQASSVSGECAGCSDDAVARSDDGYRVGAIGPAYGSCCPRFFQRIRYLSVACCRAVRDTAHFLPDRFLPVCAGRIQRDVEGCAVPFKIACQLRGDMSQYTVRLYRIAVVDKCDGDQSVLRPPEPEQSQRAIDDGGGVVHGGLARNRCS